MGNKFLNEISQIKIIFMKKNKNDDEKENEVINSNKIIKKLHAELSII